MVVDRNESRSPVAGRRSVSGTAIWANSHRDLDCVLGITIYCHQDLEILLAGFNVAYNGRRQRTLKGLSPEMVLHQHLKEQLVLAHATAKKADPTALDRALKVVADANEVSQPDAP